MTNRVYKVLRLRLGETLFCTMEAGDYSDFRMVKVFNPVEVIVGRGLLGPPRVDMRKWMPYTDDEVCTIAEDMIMSVSDLRPDLIAEYEGFLEHFDKVRWEQTTHNAVVELLKSVSTGGDVRLLDIDDERDLHRSPDTTGLYGLLDDDTDGFSKKQG